ncbi:YqgE/AlgH family protein [Persicobacter diffluens]|uniref:UPF0301 protein PEDI_13230 n=1 Tax=Persicobacter diffluens TaxID=981 RepID=A0AAN4VVL6_9BACT|nr:UPF0301 protein [Persicobacter diffluens]
MNYFDYGNISQPQKGDLLISEPFLADPNFERSVVFLVEHNEEGSVGFVLNKPSFLKLNEVMQGENIPQEQSLFVGGPVQQDTLHMVHRADFLGEESHQIVEHVYWGGGFEEVMSLVREEQQPDPQVRFFLGYSGWSPGQLEAEIQEKSWIIFRQANENLIFDTPHDDLWKKVLSLMGGRFKMYSNYPIDPRMN